MNKKSVFILFFSYVIIILSFGLWPFNFFSENRIEWDATAKGLLINKTPGGSSHHGIIYSIDNFEISRSENNPGGKLSIEIILEPFLNQNDQLHSILSFYDKSEIEPITIAQWHSALIIHNRIQNSRGKISINKIGVDSVLVENKKKIFTITSGSNGTKIYVDGVVAESNPKLLLFDKDKKKFGQLLIGASKNGKRQWSGKFEGLAIYDIVLSDEMVYKNYLNWNEQNYNNLITTNLPVAIYFVNEQQGRWIFNNIGPHHHLFIPSSFKIIQKKFFVCDFLKTSYHFSDIILNILGFMPLGLLFMSYLYNSTFSCRFQWLITLVFCIGISVIIEAFQAYLPSRNSSLQDLILNSIGSLSGLIIFKNLKFRKIG